MSQHHQHLQLLKPLPKPQSGLIPPNVFGALVGTIDHVTLNAHHGPKKDDNHVYIWIDINSGPSAGTFECAFNTQSDQETGEPAEVLFAVRDEPIHPGDIPSVGFFKAAVSYEKLGLKPDDFRPMVNGVFRSIVMHFAENCDLVSVYGTTYKEGNGLHDIHASENHTKNEDGAIAFYFREVGEMPIRRWLFIKLAMKKTGSKH